MGGMTAMKDIYSPLEIDEQWDQRAPMDDAGGTVAIDEPMMVAQTDPHAQDLHSDSGDTADTTSPQAVPAAPTDDTPATMPATPSVDEASGDPAQTPTPAQPVDDTAASEAATIDANMAHMGQTVFEPQFKPANSDDDAAAKMMGSDMPTTPANDQPAAEPVAPTAPVEPPATPEPPSEPATTPTIDEITSTPNPEPALDYSGDHVVEDVDKDLSEMVSKLEEESKKLDQDIAEKNEQILTMQKDIDAHNTKKAAIQKRIDGLKAVIS